MNGFDQPFANLVNRFGVGKQGLRSRITAGLIDHVLQRADKCVPVIIALVPIIDRLEIENTADVHAVSSIYQPHAVGAEEIGVKIEGAAKFQKSYIYVRSREVIVVHFGVVVDMIQLFTIAVIYNGLSFDISQRTPPDAGFGRLLLDGLQPVESEKLRGCKHVGLCSG